MKDINNKQIKLPADNVLSPSLGKSIEQAIRDRSIPIPLEDEEKIQELQEQIQQVVDTETIIEKVVVTVDEGNPDEAASATVTFLKGVLTLAFVNVKGATGEALTFDDLTDEQKAELKGEKGDPLTFDDLTDEQKAELKGEPGAPGAPGAPGKDGAITNLAQSVSASDTTHATSGKAVADYVAAHGGGGSVSIDTTIPASPSDSKVPSTKMLIDNFARKGSGGGVVPSADEIPYEDTNVGAKLTELDGENDSWLKGKNVVIIGDSISTKINKNAVEITISSEDVGVELSAYPTYYDVQANLVIGGHTFTTSDIGNEVTFTPTIDDVGKVIGIPNNYNKSNTTVWWEVASQKLGFNPIPVCWSGSSITSHEKNTTTRKCSWAWHESQLRKCGIRVKGTMTRNEPDVIIIYRGTNDMTHEPYSTLTDDYFGDVNFEYPTDDLLTDGNYGYKEGMTLLVSKLRERYPNAKILLCTLNVFKRVIYDHYPTNNGTNTLPQYSNAIRELADYLGCGLIEFDKDGITFENCYSQGYITDSATIPTHPNTKGHAVMAQKAIADLTRYFSN